MINVDQDTHDLITSILTETHTKEQEMLRKESVAIAYSSLLKEDPELVTTRHIEMLQKELSSRQIIAITQFILSASGEMIYAEAFLNRFEHLLSQSEPS